MKIKNVLAAAILCLSAASAQAATVLVPTDGDVNILVEPSPLSGLQPGMSLAIFDDSVTLSQMDTADKLFIASNQIVGIAGPDTGGDYVATSTDPVNTLVLTGSNQFILGLFNGDNWMMDTGLGPFALNANTVSLTFSGPNSVFLVDVKVAPIPLPAAVWLFGAGLVGLAGIARRRS